MVASAEDYMPNTLSAVDILKKSDAAGGKLAPGKYILVQQSAGGGEESTTTLHLDGDDRVDIEKNGPFTSASGTYRQQRWVQNSNGIVRLLSKHVDRVDPNTQAWDHPEDPNSGVRVLGITQDASPSYVIEANPKNGSDELRYYDAKTFLLSKVVFFGKDGHRHVTTYSDYKNCFGEANPFVIQYSDGRPQNDESTRVIAFDAAPGDTTSMEIPATRPLFDLGDKPLTLPATFSSDGIIVRVTIGGRGLDFLLDSGTSSLVIDPGAVRELRLPSYGRRTLTMGGDYDSSETIVPNMSIGPLAMRNVAFQVAPVGLQTDETHQVVGLLGYDVFASGIIGIDFPKESVTLYPSSAFDPHVLGLSPLQMQVDYGVPRVLGTVEDVKGLFLIDTGSFATFMYKRFIDQLPSVTGSVNDAVTMQAVGGDVQSRIYSVSNVALGSLKYTSAEVAVPGTSTFDILNTDGIIGRDAMQSTSLYFDYANQVMYVKFDQ
jgi:hypothetical protein